MGFAHELRFALRALTKAKGLSVTVILTLALGIGVNVAIFSLVRSVLMRPLVNRGEDRIVYIRQSAPGLGTENTTFSVPEIRDLRDKVPALQDVGEFSTVTFTMVGLGEPRQVRAGVVSGNYFEVMGLRPVLGRLVDKTDDGQAAAGVAVLTHRFWTSALNSDPSVIGKTVRLESRSAVIIGVLEPSVPYPAETELIANMVTSPHHMSATMVQGREHRMTEVFARLTPQGSIESARASIAAAYESIKRDNASSYPQSGDFRVRTLPLREQLTTNARTILIVLFASSLLIFVIACSNVANLILARTVRRESELTLRAALGAGTMALRRTLLAESVLLCSAGALLGLIAAWPMVDVLSRYAARFSVRALEVSIDGTLLALGVVLALVAAVLLAFVPTLPSDTKLGGLKQTSSVRVSGGANRRLNIFAVTQIGASFLLVTGAVMLVRTFLSLQAANPGFETRNVLAVNVPVTSLGRTPEQTRDFYRALQERITSLAGVEQVAIGSAVPWRDASPLSRAGFGFQIEGGERGDTTDDPRAQMRSVSPGFFAALGLPVKQGRDFNTEDRNGEERVVIVSESVATRLFNGRDVLNRKLVWTDPVMRFIGVTPEPRRIVGVVPDVDDMHVAPGPTLTVYHAFEQAVNGGRIFVHTRTDPYALVPQVTRIVRELAQDQPVEQAATLDDIRAEVLTPDRLNAAVFGLFAVVALAIAVIGVAGVLAFSVSGRTREFGIRMALGSRPGAILAGVVRNGATIALGGIVLGLIAGFALSRIAAAYVEQVQTPGVVVVVASAAMLIAAGVLAAAMPAARAARTNVIEALRAE
jgi:predicted permease